MSELYAEASTKKKTTIGVIILKVIAIVTIIMIFFASMFIGGAVSRILVMLGGAAVVFLIWYWPRFKVEWEYVFCDGQLDFDMILGGEKRKSILRIELEESDLVASMKSSRMDGDRHLPKKDFTSLRSEAKVYGIVTKVKDEKVVLLFEPSDKMLEKMKIKSPDKVEY